MRVPALPALLAVASLCAGCSSEPTDPTPVDSRVEVRTVQIEGELRSYLVHVPEGVDPAGAGLLIVFHGAGGSGQGMLLGLDLDRISREHGYIAAYPDANHQNWAEGCDCTAADRVHGSADTALVSHIVDDLTATLAVDPDRIWGIGFSQGGMFAQRMGCQMTHRFAGVAVVAATMSVQLDRSCDPSAPVHHITLVSTTDPVFPWEGSPDPEDNFATISAPAVFEGWVARNGCEAGTLTTTQPDAAALRYVGEGCRDGGRTELVGIEGGAHAWFMSPLVDTTAELIRFMDLSGG